MSPRATRLALLGVLLLAALLMMRPVLLDPLHLVIGSEDTEAPRHFWGLWAVAAHLREWGPFVAHLDVDYPSGYTRHLMDPINMLPFLPGYWLGGGGTQGAVIGYNLVHATWPVVGGLGGFLLTRWLLPDGPDRDASALLAAFACATAPYLVATPYLGRTELLPGVAYPLHLWLLLRALDARGRWWDIVGAGLSLAVVALGGWYLAAWIALLEPPLTLWLAARHGAPGWGRRLGRLTLIGVIAVLPVLPALQALFAWPPPIMAEAQRVSVHMGICTPPWLLLPFTGNQGLPGTDLPAYPGTVLLLLAVVGAVLERRSRPWLLLALALLVVSLGPFLVFTNDASALTQDPVRLPAWYIEKLIPPIRFIWGWCRLGIWVTWPLALAAAMGLPALLRRAGSLRTQALLVLFAAIAVDHVKDRKPAGVDGHAFDPYVPADVSQGLAALPPGAIIQLPFDDFYMTWQLGHGRPIAESLEIEDVRSVSYTVQRAQALVEALRDDEELPFDPSDPTVLTCIEDDAYHLRKAGWAGILLARDRLPDAHLPLTHLLTDALGRPVYDSELLGVWALRGRPKPLGVDCPVTPVTPIIPGVEGDSAEPQR